MELPLPRRGRGLGRVRAARAAALLFFNSTYVDQDLDRNPLWTALPVVAQGRVVRVGSHWTYGSAPAVTAVLDDLDRALDLRRP